MTFQSGQSGNPAGRPRGARGKATILAEGLFDGEAEAIIRTAIELAKSGDMACLSGTYELAMNDGTKDHGKYCEIWEKKGGTWKCGTDIWNSDLPAASSSPAPGAAERK